MHVKHIECIKCKAKYPKNKIIFRCKKCGQSLKLVYDYKEIKNNISWEKLRKRAFNHWRYREFFPIVADKNIITLREGGTPLFKSRKVGKLLGYKNLYFKFEGLNPTGSFKDRGTTVEISRANEFKVKEVVCASTGNMGASVAAYSIMANIKAKIYVPKDTTDSKIKQMLTFGAKVVYVDNHYDKALELANIDFLKRKTYMMGDYPYRGEGEKSVAFEIVDEMQPDYIVSPIGNGTLISSVWRGLNEFKIVGLIKKLPRLVGIQAKGCAPVVNALKMKKKVEAVEPRTIASAIACGSPLDGLEALNALKESKGKGETVSDAEMMIAKKMLASEGIYAELSGAATLAGLAKLGLPRDSNIVLVVTGHGLKD